MDATKGNGLGADHDQPVKGPTKYATDSIAVPPGFRGTENPRHLRAIAALMGGPIPRKQLGEIAGCSNAPELVSSLREKGLELPCARIHFIDRDGRACRPGVYSLTATDRRRLRRWLGGALG
jgi:hypothetical protein